MNSLFSEHIKRRLDQVSQILLTDNIDALVIESGFPSYYFMDDQTTFFKPNPQFLLFCPDMGEGHLLKIEPGKKPTLFYYKPSDFWHETSQLSGYFWEEHFDIKIFASYEEVWSQVKEAGKKTLLISPHPEVGVDAGLISTSESLISRINWMRISKTDYEVECTRLANKIASLGHMAAKDGFFNGKSERDIFFDYLSATRHTQAELPYGNIIAFDEKASVLHYQNLRDKLSGKTFLIDAGARQFGYCADITRTYYQDDVYPVFKDLHKGIDKVQRKLCQMVQPNFDYLKIQEQTHQEVTKLLCELSIIESSYQEAFDKKLSHSFFPHGVGHALGIQVHDVGGKQTDHQGTPSETSEDHPYLRTLRKIVTNDILTIEPGVYFIPMLLDQLKKGPDKNLINWTLVEKLLPCGGVRIEDNVVASNKGPINLTREFLPD